MIKRIIDKFKLRPFKRKEKIFYNKYSINQLDKMLMNLPFDTDKYEKILKEIQNREKDLYGNEHILCVDIRHFDDNIFKFEDMNEYYKMAQMLYINNSYKRVFYLPRYKVEHDFRYKQVLTFAYITDKSKKDYLFAKKVKNGKDALIGGHVSFNPKLYTTSNDKFLIENLIKELLEEVKIYDRKNDKFITFINGELLYDSSYRKYIYKKDNEPLIEIESKFAFNKNTDDYTLRHLAFIYEITFNVDKLFDYFIFTTNEPEEHTLSLITDIENYDFYPNTKIVENVIDYILSTKKENKIQ